MPSKQAIRRMRLARERMDQANSEHLAFTYRLGRSYSSEERAENTRLLRTLSLSIADYFEAIEQAAEQVDPVQ